MVHFLFQIIYEHVERRSGSSLIFKGIHVVTFFMTKANNLFLPFISYLLIWY